MGDGHKNRLTTSLVAMSSAAILTVYAAGYVRTRAAAARFAGEAFEPASRPAPSADPNPGRHGGAPVEVAPAKAPAAKPPSPVAVAALPTTVVEKTVTKAPEPVAPAPEPVVTPVVQSASAPVSTPSATADKPALDKPPAPVWKDGTYFGWGTSRHGDIQARVVIEEGRILSATISNCQTRYSCSVIDKLPPQVPVRQSADVDFVSGATQSTYAFYYAVLEALAKAK